MGKELGQRSNIINFPKIGEAVTIDNNALQLDVLPRYQAKSQKLTEIINVKDYRKFPDGIKKAQAFKHEFYENATERQIEEDLTSYLAEYRFEISEFEYELNIVNDKLVDPATGKLMTDLAQKAIAERKKNDQNASREKAELIGLFVLEEGLVLNPNGTATWFSPQGAKEEGYGDYGFGYVGKKEGSKLKMTAIRLEDPSIKDFNRATSAINGEEGYQKAEDFLANPRVVDISPDEVRQFIQGNFNIKSEESKKVFKKSLIGLRYAIKDYCQIILNGTDEAKDLAFHALENLSLELKRKHEAGEKAGNVIFISDYIVPDLFYAMKMKKYIVPAPFVRGSCGLSGKQESTDIFSSIKKVAKSLSKERDFEFNESGPCRLCEKDVPCGPCKICESCNDEIDANELSA